MGSAPSIPATAAAGLTLVTVGVLADCLGAGGAGTSLGSFITKALALGAGGAAGNAVWESLKGGASSIGARLRDPAERLANHDLQALAGRAIAAVAAAAAKDYPGGANGRRFIERIAKRFPPAWSKATLDARYDAILDRELPKFFGRVDGGSQKPTSLTVGLWESLVGTLVDEEVDGDGLAALKYVARRLHEQLPRALFELAKEDFAPEATGSPHQGKAFAALLLSLVRDTMGGISDVLEKQKLAIERDAELLVQLKAISNSLSERGGNLAGLATSDVAAIVKPIQSDIATLSSSLADAIGGLFDSLTALHGKANTAEAHLIEIKSKLSGRLRPETVPCNVPTPSLTFVPRRAITEKIHAALAVHPERVVVRQAVTRALGGYGKTVAAILYADQYKDHYPGGRFFLSVESGDLVTALGSLLTPLAMTSVNDLNADAAAVAQRLREGEPSLLILDNVANAASWEAMLASDLVPRGNCRVLVTTRDEAIDPAGAIKVGRLECSEAREIYRLFCEGRRDKEVDPTKRAALPDALPSDSVADEITTWLGGLAVSVAAVAAYMKLKPRLSWDAYWRGDGAKLRGLKNTPVAELPDVKPEVAKQLGIEGVALEEHRRTLRVIDDANNALPEAERRAVEYAALLPQDLAPAVWLEMLLEADAVRTADGGDAAVDPLRIELVPDPDDDRSAATRVLHHLDELDILLPGGEGGRLLSLHRLWHARLNERARQQQNDRTPLLLAIASCVAARWATLVGTKADGSGRDVNDPAVLTDQALRWELAPLAAICRALWEAGQPGPAARIGVWLSSVLQHMGRYGDAARCLRLDPTTDSLLEQTIGTEVLATSYSNLAVIQRDQGDLPGARSSMERAIEIESKHFAADHPTLATSYSNLATIQYAQGDLPGARSSMERAIEIESKHFAADHPRFATSYSNLAPIQQDQGDLPGARSSMERAIEIQSKHFAPDHPTFATRFNNLAHICLAEGDRAAACANFKIALAILRKHFSEDHPHVKIVRESMAAAGCGS